MIPTAGAFEAIENYPDLTQYPPSHLLDVKRRSHKGPRDGTKKSQTKRSATRRAAIIGVQRVTERSKDNRTVDEMSDLLLWVRPLNCVPKPTISLSSWTG
jgi:hypothetical protein